MRISLLCSDASHPIKAHLDQWMQENGNKHDISIIHDKSELIGGDLLILVSCTEYININYRQRYKSSLVIHASDLPRGRGWSPHIWSIINGEEAVTVSLIEADDKIDCGRIWKKISFQVPPHALWDEINQRLFSASIELIEFSVAEYGRVKPQGQAAESEPAYYPRRIPQDSRIDPDLSIQEQFNLIRVCDPTRYPAFFDLHGHRYKLILEKMDDQSH